MCLSLSTASHAVRVQRADPVTDQQQVWQKVREDSGPVGM